MQWQPDGDYLERESCSLLWYSRALPELPLSSMRVRLELELHEMLMWKGRMSSCLPVALPARNIGSWRDVFCRAELPSSYSTIFPQMLALNGFLAWQVLPSLTSLFTPM